MKPKPTRHSVPNSELLECVSDLVASGKTVVLPARGNSMLPFIRDGRDSVELTAPAHPGPGCVALCRLRPGCYVLHRIVSIEGNSVVLRGDGNLSGVEFCTVSDIIAVAVALIRPSGRRVSFSDHSYKRKVRLWLSAPHIVRRVCLGIARRLL